jgi:hypothetical protein
LLAAGSTFTLTEVDNTTHGSTGLPTITANETLTILGNGGVIERSTAVASPKFRLFNVAPDASLALENLTLQGGSTELVSPNGGAIYNAGTLTLTNVTVQNNVAMGRVGATCTIPCGPYPGGPGWPGAGGGIYSTGSMNLENTMIRNNRAEGGRGGFGAVGGFGRGGEGAGGAFYAAAGTVTMRGSSVTANNSQGGIGSPSGSGYGGGIYVANAQLAVDGFTVSHVTGNTASTNYPNIFGPYQLIPNSYPLPADYNTDGAVDVADYIVWRKRLGTTHTPDDYNVWRASYGQTAGGGAALPSAVPLSTAVPEPRTGLLIVIGCAVARGIRSRRVAKGDVRFKTTPLYKRNQFHRTAFATIVAIMSALLVITMPAVAANYSFTTLPTLAGPLADSIRCPSMTTARSRLSHLSTRAA